MPKANTARVLTQPAKKEDAARKQSSGGSGRSVIKNAEPLTSRPAQADEDTSGIEERSASGSPEKSPPVGSEYAMNATEAEDDSAHGIDQELADDLDELVEGDFESVDEVLEGATDEPTASDELVTDNAAPEPDDPVAPNEAEAADEPASDEPASDEGGAVMDALDEAGDEARETSPPEDIAPNDPPLNDVENDGEPTDEVAPGDTPEVAAQYPPTAAVDDDHDDALDAPAHLGIDPAPSPIDSAQAPGESSEDTSSKESAPPLHRRLLAPVAACCIAALSLMSAPMRYVPESIRPLVDWIAISLVFWVPVVWVLAFVLSG